MEHENCKKILENSWIFFQNAQTRKEKSAKILKRFKMADFQRLISNTIYWQTVKRNKF